MAAIETNIQVGNYLSGVTVTVSIPADIDISGMTQGVNYVVMKGKNANTEIAEVILVDNGDIAVYAKIDGYPTMIVRTAPGTAATGSLKLGDFGLVSNIYNSHSSGYTLDRDTHQKRYFITEDYGREDGPNIVFDARGTFTAVYDDGTPIMIYEVEADGLYMASSELVYDGTMYHANQILVMNTDTSGYDKPLPPHFTIGSVNSNSADDTDQRCSQNNRIFYLYKGQQIEFYAVNISPTLLTNLKYWCKVVRLS